MSDPAPMSELVEFYVAHGLAEGMLAAHVDDGTGHCAGCAWPQTARPVHPCTLRHAAEAAIELKR
jgi:hypothetical protein